MYEYGTDIVNLSVWKKYYSDVIMGGMASQITGVSTVFLTFC